MRKSHPFRSFQISIYLPNIYNRYKHNIIFKNDTTQYYIFDSIQFDHKLIRSHHDKLTSELNIIINMIEHLTEKTIKNFLMYVGENKNRKYIFTNLYIRCPLNKCFKKIFKKLGEIYDATYIPLSTYLSNYNIIYNNIIIMNKLIYKKKYSDICIVKSVNIEMF